MAKAERREQMVLRVLVVPTEILVQVVTRVRRVLRALAELPQVMEQVAVVVQMVRRAQVEHRVVREPAVRQVLREQMEVVD